jgi:hypothetical protein
MSASASGKTETVKRVTANTSGFLRRSREPAAWLRREARCGDGESHRATRRRSWDPRQSRGFSPRGRHRAGVPGAKRRHAVRHDAHRRHPANERVRWNQDAGILNASRFHRYRDIAVISRSCFGQRQTFLAPVELEYSPGSKASGTIARTIEDRGQAEIANLVRPAIGLQVTEWPIGRRDGPPACAAREKSESRLLFKGASRTCRRHPLLWIAAHPGLPAAA